MFNYICTCYLELTIRKCICYLLKSPRRKCHGLFTFIIPIVMPSLLLGKEDTMMTYLLPLRKLDFEGQEENFLSTLRMFPSELLVKTWSLQSTMMMVCLLSWMVLKKHHREKHSHHRLLMNLQKKRMNQWSTK